MKNILLRPALAAILGLALASFPVSLRADTSTNSVPDASTATNAAATEAPMHTKAKTHPYSGSITAMDASSVTVATSKKTLVLAISPTTSFKVNHKMAAATDFAVGDKVTGSFTKDESGAMTAYSIHKK